MKIFKIILSIVIILALIGGGTLYWFIKKNSPAPEERLAFANDKIIKNIDTQLKNINIDQIKQKAEFIEQKSLEEIKENIKNKKINYKELTAYYLIKIKEKDKSTNGNNAISEINPKALEEAISLDNENNQEDKILKGIPVVLKENINTNNMPTSAGAYALKDFIPSSNAPMVDELIKNGAIILGKTNLSEMSHWMGTKVPSGYSSKNGQTHNPFDPLKSSPLGSSTGSAVAMATDLATLSIGTETVGSIIAPASVNSVVGYKPTRNNISGDGVLPITKSLDTVGVITKNVKDAVITYNASSDKKFEIPTDTNYIKGKRIGIINKSIKNNDYLKNLKEKLANMGATIVEIELQENDLDPVHILHNDFEKDLNNYLKTYNAPIKSLKELIEFNKKDEKTNMRYGQNHLEDSLNYNKKDDEKVKKNIKLAQEILEKIINDNKLDAIISKDNDLVTIPAIAGAPEITIPFGIYDKVPSGATFFTTSNKENNLLKIAYSFEQNTKLRKFV